MRLLIMPIIYNVVDISHICIELLGYQGILWGHILSFLCQAQGRWSRWEDALQSFTQRRDATVVTYNALQSAARRGEGPEDAKSEAQGLPSGKLTKSYWKWP